MTFLEPSNAETLRELTLLLFSLDFFQGPRAQPLPRGPETKDDLTRSFLEALACICAYDKGSDYVIAAALQDKSALQEKSTGTVLWLACNKAIDKSVKEFLEPLLDKLRETIRPLDGCIDADEAESLCASKLLPDIIKFQAPKIQVYYNKSSENFDTSHLSDLCEWLKQRFPDGESRPLKRPQLEELVLDCCALKDSVHIGTLRRLGQQENEGHAHFQLLKKLLGKIGKCVAFAQALFKAAIKLPELDRKLQIKTIPNKSKKEGPLPSGLTLKNIVKKIFSSEIDRTRYLDRLKFLNKDKDISKILESRVEDETIVHAELLILDLFFKNNYEFVGGDKYIGCSKPACYLCHAFMEYHPGRFVVPPCHNRIYPKWRTTDIDPQDPESMERMEKITASLIEKLKEDLYAEMNSTEDRRPYHPDSPEERMTKTP